MINRQCFSQGEMNNVAKVCTFESNVIKDQSDP